MLAEHIFFIAVLFVGECLFVLPSSPFESLFSFALPTFAGCILRQVEKVKANTSFWAERGETEAVPLPPQSPPHLSLRKTLPGRDSREETPSKRDSVGKGDVGASDVCKSLKMLAAPRSCMGDMGEGTKVKAS